MPSRASAPTASGRACLPGRHRRAGYAHRRPLRARRRRGARASRPRRPPPTETAGASTARRSLVVGADRAAAILVPARTGESALGRVPRRPDARRGSRSSAETAGQRRAAVDRPPRRRRGRGATHVLGDPDAGRRDRRAGSTDRLIAAICATQTGVCEEALRHHRRVRVRARAVRQQARHLPGRRRSASPTPTSTPRRSASRPCQAIWRLVARASMPTTSS